MMGIALGGLGVMSLRLPYSFLHSHSSWSHLVDLRTVLMASFVVLVICVLAFCTNPTESSFRTFLTEQVFRQHLSRLRQSQDGDCDDEADEDLESSTQRLSALSYSKNKKREHGKQEHDLDPDGVAPVLFHFANKASVTLRTPGYQFRSFGFVSFAVVSPIQMSLMDSSSSLPPSSSMWNNPSMHGTWFVGAFGRWWIGLELNMNPREVQLSVKDDDEVHEPIIPQNRAEQGPRPMRTMLVRDPAAKGLPRTKAVLRERLTVQISASQQQHQHPHQQSKQPPHRPVTPPPLPKSASLPLHAKRAIPQPAPNNRHPKLDRPCAPLLPTANSSSSVADPFVTPTRSRRTSTIDPSPVIADVLQQIESSHSAIGVHQAQLNDLHTASAKVQAGLSTELEGAREQKRCEDAGRAELKARTKTLDDARRQADGKKREADKRLKVATSARDGAADRIESLNAQINNLKQQMETDKLSVEDSVTDTVDILSQLNETTGLKQTELEATEVAVESLVCRHKELEALVVEESERLAKVKQSAENKKRHAMLQTHAHSWPPPPLIVRRPPPAELLVKSPPASPPRPPPLSLAGISNLAPSSLFGAPSTTIVTAPNSNSTSLDTEYTPSTQFKPFADSPSSAAFTGPLSPVSTSLIPTSLMQSMESPRAFTNGADPVFKYPAMRSSGAIERPGMHNSSSREPTLLQNGHSMYDEPTSGFVTPFDAQRAVRPPEIAPPTAPSLQEEATSIKHRRWFSSASSSPSGPAKEKGLNPTAKAFTFTGARSLVAPRNTPTASLTPDVPAGFGSLFSTLSHAFAPSAAEREVLLRSLGSPANGSGSLERVSSHGSGSSVQSSPLLLGQQSQSQMHPDGKGWGGGQQHHHHHQQNSAPPHKRLFNPWIGQSES